MAHLGASLYFSRIGLIASSEPPSTLDTGSNYAPSLKTTNRKSADPAKFGGDWARSYADLNDAQWE